MWTFLFFVQSVNKFLIVFFFYPYVQLESTTVTENSRTPPNDKSERRESIRVYNIVPSVFFFYKKTGKIRTTEQRGIRVIIITVVNFLLYIYIYYYIRIRRFR